MKIIISAVIIFFHLGVSGTPADESKENLDYYYKLFRAYYDQGDFLKCESTLLAASHLKLSEYGKAFVYNNLGVTYFNLGNYDGALEAYSRIDSLNLTPDEINVVAPSTLVNRAVIFGKRKIHDKAISYYERAIRILEQTAKNENFRLRELSLAYHNLGTVYSERGEFLNALQYFKHSLSLMEKNGINEKELPLSTLAKCYAGLHNPTLAEDYFRRCIATSISENGPEYFRLYEVYVLYADFLADAGRYSEASSVYRKVLGYSLRKYGLKNAHTSAAYKNLGELKFKTDEYDSSLYFYQKSLISVVSHFNDENIENNPGIDSSYNDVRLLDNLKGKSKVLATQAGSMNSQKDRIKTLELGLSTAELAMDLAEIIRNNFPTEDSKIYLSEIEKETYISGIRIASDLYGLTKSNDLPARMYNFIRRSKAAILRNQITDNKILYASAVPDSLIEEQRSLASNIAGYKMLILNEENTVSPAKTKINLWKDELFQMNLHKEAVDREIANVLPAYSDLSQRTALIPLDAIMNNLDRDEAIIDYYLSDKYTESKRELFIFLLTRKELKFYKSQADSLFSTDARILKNTSDPVVRDGKGDFRNYLSALYNMYNILIKPFENQLKKRLIIIPDEEISWLPFEAFLCEMPSGDPEDFEGLHFLLYDHSFSYSYSSSLISEQSELKGRKIIGFLPAYNRASGLNQLNGAKEEMESVSGIIDGKVFTGQDASRTNFLKSIRDSVIFHLAMHAVYDSANSLNSYLLFGSGGNDPESARLYNYEISLVRMKTPMIVLSSCNSGSGILKRSEGLMSIARSFILAGASSVVRTAWEVNDESGSEIITLFYQYLARGYTKDKALQMAKTEFIEKSSPAYRDPYYWAAYEILGDNSRIRHNRVKIVTFVTISVLLILSAVFFYFKRLRIFAARLP